MNSKDCNTKSGFFIFQTEMEDNFSLFFLPEFEELDHPAAILEVIDRLRINPEIGEKIAVGLGLTYLDQGESGENLCMANNEEVLPEFREICTDKDLRSYVSSVLRSLDSEKSKNYGATKIKIPFPDNSKSFWALVEKERQKYN